MLPIAYRLLIFSALTLASVAAYGQRDRDTYNPGNQTFEVTGLANLAGTNDPAINVPVRLERFSGGIIDQISTDTRGRFRFSNLQSGYYKIIINTPRYAPVPQDADHTLRFKTYLIFNLAKTDSSGASGLAASLDVIDARVPPSARAEFVRGREALSRKNHPEAIAHFQKAISLYP